jgi:YidC/Oxa1 family membrane protein insertase
MNNKRPDTGNYMAALALSAAVLFLWQYFFIAPLAERQRHAAEQAAQTTAPAAPGTAAVTAAGTPATPQTLAPAAIQPRELVLASSGARLKFENSKVDGSIRLTGAQIDDLRLKKYRETLDPTSPEVVFLTPHGTANATFAETGWAAAPGSHTKVPDSTTLWSTTDRTLTPTTPVTLTWNNGEGLTFVRRIALDDDYMFTVTDTVENSSTTPITLFPYAIIAREGEPVHTAQWTLHEGLFGVLQGLLEKHTYADMRDAKTPEAKFEGTSGWLGITDKYWMATLVPPQKEKFTGRFSIAREKSGEIFRADYLLGARNISAGAQSTVTHNVFAGAKIVSLVETYQDKLGIFRYDMTIDWGWFSIITYWMFKGLDQINKLVGNFGIAIILLTVIVKILFFPLANRSYESMTKMKKVQPEMKSIQERFKEDRVKQQQEIMALYKREKINPLMGCLPLLLQIPIFFSLYKVLFVTIEMRHAPFFGWIQDLAAADPTSLFNLFGLLPYAVPTWLHIGVWPLFMGVTMWFQMKMSPPSPDPTQRQMMVMMPPVFTYLMASFPAGLVIYWTLNNILSIFSNTSLCGA